MKLLILGASGGCGQWLVRLAAEHGHEVTAVVRPSTSYQPPSGARVARAEVAHGDALDSLVQGQEAVLCCLGQRRAGKSPWAPLLSPPDLTERVARHLVAAMRRHGVPRVVAISAGGVGDSSTQLTLPVRWLVRSGNVGVAYRDLEAMERELAASGLDWLAVRPVTLVDGPPSGGAGQVDRYRLTSTVRRSEVAEYMLAAAESAAPFAERTVLLGSAGSRR